MYILLFFLINSIIIWSNLFIPAAIQQLKIVSENAKSDFFEKGNIQPSKTAKESLDFGVQ